MLLMTSSSNSSQICQFLCLMLSHAAVKLSRLVSTTAQLCGRSWDWLQWWHSLGLSYFKLLELLLAWVSVGKTNNSDLSYPVIIVLEDVALFYIFVERKTFLFHIAEAKPFFPIPQTCTLSSFRKLCQFQVISWKHFLWFLIYMQVHSGLPTQQQQC